MQVLHTCNTNYCWKSMETHATPATQCIAMRIQIILYGLQVTTHYKQKYC